MDSPSETTEPELWVRVTEYGGYNGYTLWIRRSDSGGNTLLVDGQPQDCTPIPNPVPGSATPETPPNFECFPPGNARGGTYLTGNESVAYQVAFVVACESGAEGYSMGSSAMRQTMTDIAYVIRARMQATGFPDTPLDVICQATLINGQPVYQFQCYGEGSGADLTDAIGQAAPIAESLVANQPLPEATFPSIESALFFLGVLCLDGANLTANSIPRNTVISHLINIGAVGVSAAVLDGIYLGHGQFGSAGAGGGFGTLFFSDDPRFTGVPVVFQTCLQP